MKVLSLGTPCLVQSWFVDQRFPDVLGFSIELCVCVCGCVCVVSQKHVGFNFTLLSFPGSTLLSSVSDCRSFFGKTILVEQKRVVTVFGQSTQEVVWLLFLATALDQK